MTTRPDPLSISVETLAAAWPLLGHRLDIRRPLRLAQQPALTRRFLEASATPLADREQQLDFVCSPFDVLAERRAGATRFHIIELNGTGIGGVTNLPAPVIGAMRDSIAQIGATLTQPGGVVLLGISGKEDPNAPRMNHLMHEKMMFAEALLDGLRETHGVAHLLTAQHLLAGQHLPSGPVVVMGYMKDLLDLLQRGPRRTLRCDGRQVVGILNDRFCVNVLNHFGLHADPEMLRPINTSFVAGSDKAVAQRLVNEFVQGTRHAEHVPGLAYEVTHDRDDLIAAVTRWLRAGRRAVIKPHGTGIGHGIEFFLDPQATLDTVVATIDRSILETQAFYRIRGGAFPYTVCEFVDTPQIDRPGHPLHGHKYELRIVVFRDGPVLRAFPAVAKIASVPYDPAQPSRASLINNITASSVATKRGGVSFSLPLTNEESLATLQLSVDELEALCVTCTGLMRYTLDDLRRRPERHGLRAAPRSLALAAP